MANFTQDQVLDAYAKAPEPIQEAFSSELTADVVSDIKTKFRLHVDVAGNLGKEVGYLMLGLINPAEFFGSLMLAGTDEATTKGIMEEINSRIFIPLKQQVSATGRTPAPAPITYAETPVAEQRPAPMIPPPALEYEPAQTGTLPGSSEPIPVVAPSISAPTQERALPTPQEVHTMMSDMLVAKQTAAPAPIIPVQPTAPNVPLPPAPVVPQPNPIAKDYGVDPYREPV